MKMFIATLLFANLVVIAFAEYATECDCGKQYIDDRIIGGTQAKRGAYIFHVAFLDARSAVYFCAGTLVNDRWVITAAHCVQNENLFTFVAVIGAHDLREKNLKKYAIDKIIKHPNYTHTPNFLYDIAVIKLNENVVLNNKTGPACLPSEDMANVDILFDNLVVTGFGKTSKDDDASAVLMEVDLQQRNQSECKAIYNKKTSRYTDRHICANKRGKDVCNGDSGGPLVTKRRGLLHLAGAVSWGIICGEYKYPSVFTRISAYKDWYSNYINEDATTCKVK